eukprot:CAMPEP_0179067450 /NCGR_PEP_ID=MMETSP0796-20121207/29494_1 /TAXON_ID=73915 /ORGANISM="Pyrodinium bahamense, Strain pbaha01" /LENGTH=143 /DNA_ID=CAMNT_0020764477 /DNA_START=1 /DNA_END=436 /DNA_ORIENTATION=-
MIMAEIIAVGAHNSFFEDEAAIGPPLVLALHHGEGFPSALVESKALNRFESHGIVARLLQGAPDCGVHLHACSWQRRTLLWRHEEGRACEIVQGQQCADCLHGLRAIDSREHYELPCGGLGGNLVRWKVAVGDDDLVAMARKP